ncbi:hypothetical protein E2C01_058719 [Portunus trituberculatus]|uniref:Uncharacterized protein n=1 Tax=Portunus trituberculatus TaxID=210409 RepID=A0A5B7GX81_PORTR|nr:hypothetical protein [Portunus trituberculatus]
MDAISQQEVPLTLLKNLDSSSRSSCASCAVCQPSPSDGVPLRGLRELPDVDAISSQMRSHASLKQLLVVGCMV